MLSVQDCEFWNQNYIKGKLITNTILLWNQEVLGVKYQEQENNDFWAWKSAILSISSPEIACLALLLIQFAQKLSKYLKIHCDLDTFDTF